jgi:transposase-like protein
MAASSNRTLSARYVAEPKLVVIECRIAIKLRNGSISEAARKLGISRRTLHRWIREHPEILKGVRR